MSAISNGLRTRFAGLLRDLLRRFDETEAGIPQPPRIAAPVPPSPLPAPASASVAKPASTPVTKPVAPATPKAVAAPAVPKAASAPTVPQAVAAPAAPSASKPPQAENVNYLELPLEPVLQTLPLELHSKMRAKNVDLSRASISIALKKIQPQLALGVVRITFGELRRAAPALFDVQDQYDSLPVMLPLNKVLERLSPNFLVRNPAQKIVEVPAEISGPFGGRGQGAVISTTTTAKRPIPTPSIKREEPLPVVPSKPEPLSVAPPPPPKPRSITPSPAVVPAPHSPNGADNGALAKPVTPATPTRIVTPAVPVVPVAPVTPAVPTAAVPSPVGMSEATISLPLAALSEKWPQTLQSEVAQLTSANTQIALPARLLEEALKQGRVTFTWENLRSWAKPMPPAASPHDAVVVELPLKVIVPYFLGKQGLTTGTAKQRQTVSVSPEIPNLFFGFPQPQAPAETEVLPADGNCPAPKPVETKPPATEFFKLDKPDTSRVEARTVEAEPKRPATPGTDFISRTTPPKEVVSRAMALDGVAGAVVALPDGLMVASQVPSGLSADTLAAFLPQIFDRVSQSSKELRMGALNNLNFIVGDVPWEIFRVNGVYFAAFGRNGGHLPTAQLTALASELERKKQ